MCFFLAGTWPGPGPGLALEEELCVACTGLFVATGDAEIVALVSESTRATETPPALSLSELSSELSSDEEEVELLESEEGGSGVFLACFRAFESAFWPDSFSESDKSESEDSESDESLELLELDEVDSDDEESDESESDFDEGLTLDILAFLALGASSDESESELDSEDEELLDSAFRFTPVSFFAAGAGVGAARSSSSSSASLSELEDGEDEEEDDDDDARDALTSFFGASFISTSESLSSLSELELELELLSLSDSLLEDELLGLEEEGALEAGFFSHDWKSSSKDGTFFTFAGVLPARLRSFSKAAPAPENPLSERKVETAASSCGETLGGDIFASTCQRNSYQ